MAIVLAAIVYAVYQWFKYPFAWERESVQGCAGAAVTGVIAILFLYERAVFKFDRLSQRLVWSRRRIFSQDSGVIPFSDITMICVRNRLATTRSNAARRVSIQTATKEIPLSVMYRSGMKEESEALAARIREFIGRPVPSTKGTG